MATPQELVARIKKARETVVQIESSAYHFVVRRPTDMEMLEAKSFTRGELLARFVIDWPGIKEVDLVPGGTGVEVPFDSALFVEWVADKPNLWGPLITAIIDSYEAHQKRIDEALGKPEPG